ncbi:hypothetical protein QQ045_025964 [Rhodiola kirilowii]
MDKSRGHFRTRSVAAPQQGSSCTSASSDLSYDAKLVVGESGMNLTAWRKDEVSIIGKVQDAPNTLPSILSAKNV